MKSSSWDMQDKIKPAAPMTQRRLTGPTFVNLQIIAPACRPGIFAGLLLNAALQNMLHALFGIFYGFGNNSALSSPPNGQPE
jgi:hypothetical protein